MYLTLIFCILFEIENDCSIKVFLLDMYVLLEYLTIVLYNMYITNYPSNSLIYASQHWDSDDQGYTDISKWDPIEHVSASCY